MLFLLIASLCTPARAARFTLRAPTPQDLASQETLLGLEPGARVKPAQLVAALKRESWVRSVEHDDQGISVRLVHGAISSLRLQLDDEGDGKHAAAVALDAAVRGSPTWLELLGDTPPGQPLGFDAQGRTLWSVSPGIAVATTRDDQGVLRPTAFDAGQQDVAVAAGDLQVAFTQALAAGDLDTAEDMVERLAPFGLRQVMPLTDRWRDRRAALCGVPLVVLANRAVAADGIERRRATRAAVEHALSSCRTEGGALLSVAQPRLSQMVADIGTLPGIEGQSAWAELGKGRIPQVEALEDLAQALRLHRGPGAAAWSDGTWEATDWPGRVALLAGLETSIRRATSQERPGLEAARSTARQELRRQLVAERDRAFRDARLATAEVIQAVLVAMSGQRPARVRPLTADDDVATWIRSALVTVEGRDDAPELLRAAIASNRLDTVGLTLPDPQLLAGDPAVVWGTVEIGILRSSISGPEVARETLLHSWRAPTKVPDPRFQAAMAQRIRIAEAMVEQGREARPLVPAAPILVAPGQVAPGQDLDSYRDERMTQLESRLRELAALPATSVRREPSLVAFQAEVQRWRGTVQRRLRLTLPSGIFSHEPVVDVAEWRYVRHGANPAVELIAQDQLTDKPSVLARATTELDAGQASDLVALLAQGIGAQAWAQATSLDVPPGDQALEAAALHWLLTGREAPDIQGIGFIDGLSPGPPAGIPGDALMVRVSPDGERALVLRSPFVFEIYEVSGGRRLLGPYEVQGRVNVVDGDSVSVAFTPDGEAVRVADTAIDLSSGRVLGDDERLARPWLKIYENSIAVDGVSRDGQPQVRVQGRLSRAAPRTAPLPSPDGRAWSFGHGIAAPDLDEVAVELHTPGGDTAVVVFDLPDANLLGIWTEGGPRLGRTSEGVVIADRRGVQMATWAARGLDLRAFHPRPPIPGAAEGGGQLLWQPAGVVEVFDQAAVFYGLDGGWTTTFPLPAGGSPALLDDGRVLLTHGAAHLHLTPVPSMSEALR